MPGSWQRTLYATSACKRITDQHQGDFQLSLGIKTLRTEQGTIRKPRSAAVNVALVYPNTYRVGMSNLGFQTVYRYLNSREDYSAERFFLPDFEAKGQPLAAPRSEETNRPLKDFPVIAFSVPFENDYPAVPGMLLSAGIPPLQKDRGEGDPLVIAGGVSVSMNPEPLAPFVDLCFLGEIEDDPASAAAVFFFVLAEGGNYFHSPEFRRRDLLKLFSNVPSAYVPSAYIFHHNEDGTIAEIVPQPGFPERVKSARRPAKNTVVPASVIFSPEAEFGQTFLLEVNRGCGRRCRFCAGGWIHHPVRYIPYARFQPDVIRAIGENRTIGLIGSDLAGHPELEDILEDILDRGGRFSLSSIRPEGLSPTIIRFLAQTGQKTATLAPEVASSRLKGVIGKNIPSETFYEIVDKLVSAGIPNIRLYFMIGLPSETEDDVLSIVDFVRRTRSAFVEASRPKGRIGRLGVQVNPFVPKPWTPFQWAAMLGPRELDSRLRIISEGLRKESNVIVRTEPGIQAVMQGFLSRGDRRIQASLLHAAIHDRRWRNSFKKESHDAVFYAYRERGAQEIFPWDVTDHGIRKEILWKAYAEALG